MPRKMRDLTDEKFGRLTVISFAGRKGSTYYWNCRCSCGKDVVVRGTHLTSQITKSCGCLNREVITKHGKSYDSIYDTWHNMKFRCANPNDKRYADYGGRGITVCEEWKNSFQAFYDYVSKLEHFGEKGYSLDRIDNNGNYEPSNIRWADAKTQDRNRRTNIMVECDGESLCLKDAAEKTGINYGTLMNRYRHGDTGERLFRPVKGR